MKKYLSFFFIPLLISLACSAGAATPVPDKLATIVASTLTAVVQNAPVVPTATAVIPAATVVPPSATIAIPPTAPETGARYVYTAAQNVNLRVNPGTSFKVSRVLAEGTQLTLLGVAPGGAWLNVRNGEGIVGWVGSDFVSGGFDGPPPPVVVPTGVQTITGKVTDVNGAPATGIGFAFVQGAYREDGVTDQTGTFYVYLPTQFTGEWTVSFVSVDCTSNTRDAACQCVGGTCGKPDPELLTVTLPLSAPLNFTWK